MKRAERTVVRGIIGGLIAATVLVLWFLVIDTINDQPFRTPAFLASILAHVDGVQHSIGLIAMYTALHYVAFFLVGVVVAWLVEWLEVAPGVLLGLVLGFLLFDLVFYFGIVHTGVDIVQELGWPEVLLGNLLAGLALMGYLHVSSEREAVTWWHAFTEQRILREGIVAGLLGALVVALWFLLFDVIRDQVFFTPGALGSAFFLRVNNLAQVEINLLTVGGYTGLHVAGFAAAGLVAAAIACQAERRPPLVLAAVLLFAAFEALFIGLLAIAAEWLLGTLAWWTIAVGNLLATVSMAYYLWKAHPALRRALREDPLGKEWPEGRDFETDRVEAG